MNTKLRNRLELLERSEQRERDVLAQEIIAAAVSAMSNEDLDHLESCLGRGEPFSKISPAEKAALEKYDAQKDAAALNRTGRTCRELGLFQILG